MVANRVVILLLAAVLGGAAARQGVLRAGARAGDAEVAVKFYHSIEDKVDVAAKLKSFQSGVSDSLSGSKSALTVSVTIVPKGSSKDAKYPVSINGVVYNAEPGKSLYKMKTAEDKAAVCMEKKGEDVVAAFFKKQKQDKSLLKCTEAKSSTSSAAVSNLRMRVVSSQCSEAFKFASELDPLRAKTLDGSSDVAVATMVTCVPQGMGKFKSISTSEPFIILSVKEGTETPVPRAFLMSCFAKMKSTLLKKGVVETLKEKTLPDAAKGCDIRA